MAVSSQTSMISKTRLVNLSTPDTNISALQTNQPQLYRAIKNLGDANKQLINSELSKISEGLGVIYKKLEETSQLMDQEDADDIYDVRHCHTSICSLYAEWNRFKDCLNKELELSLPI